MSEQNNDRYVRANDVKEWIMYNPKLGNKIGVYETLILQALIEMHLLVESEDLEQIQIEGREGYWFECSSDFLYRNSCIEKKKQTRPINKLIKLRNNSS